MKYKLGIIPHFRDKNNLWLKCHFSQNPEIKIIDIQNNNPLKVVDDMLECEKIISSSLHGIIITDAYAVPSLWFELSDLVEGTGFKFRDYFASVGRTIYPPFLFGEFKNLDEILNVFEPYKINHRCARSEEFFSFLIAILYCTKSFLFNLMNLEPTHFCSKYVCKIIVALIWSISALF
jgi:hypothetical protein